VLVVDTSAVVAALTGRPPPVELTGRLGAGEDLAAPHLLDVEFLHALRRLVQVGQLSEDRAADARDDFAALAVIRYGHTMVADRIWELRGGLTADDATFVALAELLDAPLVTCDARLARASGHHATVELYQGVTPSR
jgi:predicted nucleic acid-binding protein